MIPQRVRLKGFLCYKDEQTIDFDGNATLWMLSGLNGSGKSSIFDAITYALFGSHRGGASQAHELINKDADTLTIEFDFLLDQRPYRAKRTLRRNTQGGARGTQQLYERCNDAWVPVPETDRKVGFDAWVAERIGLDYTTFTSSVLLLQGKAEKLLDSKPEGRREVLAGIVDLERFERLFQRADQQRKEKEADLKAVATRLSALPPVQPLELHAARERIAAAEADRTGAGEEVDRLQAVEFQSRAWQDLQKRLHQGRGRCQRRTVLQDAAAIEEAVERLRDLRDVYPRLNEIAVLRGQAREADTLVRAREAERERLNASLREKRNALEQTTTRRAALHSLIAGNEATHREVSARLRVVTAKLERLREGERQENELTRLREELAALPAEPEKRHAAAREAFERVEVASRVLPQLTRFQARRDELIRTLAEERGAEERLQAVRRVGERLKAESEGLRGALEQATRSQEQASAAATEARTLLQQAREALDELSSLDGARVCRHCGQALTAAHLGEEKRRRAAAVAAAEARSNQAIAAEESARRTAEERRDHLARAEKAREEAREEFRDAQAQLKQARALIERTNDDCAHLHEQLPEALRGRVRPEPAVSWQATTFPAAADLEALRSQARDLEPARRRLREAETTLQCWRDLEAQRVTTLETLNRLLRDLPGDRGALRREHADLETQERGLFKSIDTARQQVQEVERQAVQLTGECNSLGAEIGRVETRIKEQHLVQQNAERGIHGQRKLLPPRWQAQADNVGIRELQTLKSEQEQLERDRTDERGRELEQARHHLTELETDVRQLEEQEKGFPPEVREDVEVVAGRLREARGRHAACDQALALARQEFALLDNIVSQRRSLDEEYRRKDGELAADRRLAELLGKDRLQLHLVRQAERQVVEYANAVLDRLSGGQLYLKLTGEAAGEGASAKALDLEAYNRTTGERPINVAFLSGSQKFRVAVSLALGIGQYASRRHRPIESVIIDEGFGCLDTQGRQVMIQELQNLRSQMRCILLVSHQEDFAESFSDGYQFRLENGATRVERFRK